MSEEFVCAEDGCHCRVHTESAVHANGCLYCSERCVDGRGCDHAGCNCGKFPTAEPVSELSQTHQPHH
jgi:hypothetical protein